LSPDALRPYLVELGIEKAKDVHQAALRPLGLRLTPTLVILDSRGRVEAAWAGRLSGSQEREVFAALQTELPAQVGRADSSEDSVPVVKTEELRLLLKDPHTVVVDVRERSRFHEAHLPNCLNMPIDEIAPRAPHELPDDREILLYAHDYMGQRCSGPKTSLSKGAVAVLRHEGFMNVRIIADDLATLARAGIRVEGKPCP
jgi:rhodanese-related sulfurtransferase